MPERHRSVLATVFGIVGTLVVFLVGFIAFLLAPLGVLLLIFAIYKISTMGKKKAKGHEPAAEEEKAPAFNASEIVTPQLVIAGAAADTSAGTVPAAASAAPLQQAEIISLSQKLAESRRVAANSSAPQNR